MSHPKRTRLSTARSNKSNQRGIGGRPRRTRLLRTEALERRLLLATVTSELPPANSHTAAVSTDVAATYDENINAGTVNDQTFAVHPTQSGRLIGSAATVTTDGPTVTLDPAADFFPGELVKVTATSSIQGTTGGVRRTWSFRAGVTSGSGVFADSGQTGLGSTYKNRLGDLDGDGDLDAYVVDGSGTNRVMLNDGSGVFTTSQDLGNLNTYDVRLGDLDSDGDLDAFVTAELYTPNRILLNDGTGQFSAGQVMADHASLAVDLGDLDGDGDLDAYVGTRENNLLLLNNGSGIFTDTEQNVGRDPARKVIIGDVDQDGDLDLLSGDPDNPDRLYLNDGNASFTASSQSIGAPNSRAIYLGDVDGDGDPDLVIAHTGNGSNHVWFNNGSGVFTDSGQRLGDHNTWGLGFGDLDGDGDLDMIGGNDGGQDNRVWLNDGSGVFSDSGETVGVGTTRSFGIGDLDGDGDLDAFVANLSGSQIWFNENLTPSVTLGVESSIPEAAGVATVTATLSAAHTAPVTVDLEFTGSATATDDYTASATQIVIPTGSMSGSITITAVQDAIDEPDETIVVDITGVTNGQEAGIQQVTTTILDDDEPAPVPDVTLAVDNTNIPETGGVATFTANLSVVTTVAVTIDLAISGTASAGDFTASATQIVVAAGSTSGTITVTAVADEVDESDETVIVDIASVTGGTESGDQQQTTTITDDDEPPVPNVTLAVDNGSIPEAAGVANFTITLSEPTTVPVTVDLGISGTAAASDYTASATQVVVGAGTTSATVTVTAVQDELSEPDETVIVDIASVTGGNEDGDQQQTTTIVDDDAPPSFTVTSLDATNSGFRAQFNNPLDGSGINLYDTLIAGQGAADVVVTGAASGAIAGSLLVDTSSIEFIKSGEPLAADTYTVTLRSAADGFKDTSALLLDGNGDGTGGDNYVGNFTVAEAPEGARNVSIPDFVRGPGQDVNLPADETTGIPITISDGANVRAVDMRIGYDPALLEITGATAPAGGTVVLNTTTTPGVAILVYFSTASLPAGNTTFINLQATVPTANASAIYGEQQILDVHDVTVGDGNDNEFISVIDDALHFATFFADVSGNGRVNASDAAQVARFAALIDSGFAASLNTDPIVVGDISGNGRINAADASRVAQFAALIAVPEIPPIPAGVVITGVPGAPLLPGNVALQPGSSPDTARPSSSIPSLDQGELSPAVDIRPALDQLMAEIASEGFGSDDEELLAPLEQAIEELFLATN